MLSYGSASGLVQLCASLMKAQHGHVYGKQSHLFELVAWL